MAAPRIGIILDSVPSGEYSQYPWYALRKHYSDALVRAGGVPYHLSYHPALAEETMKVLDGLLLAGGDFDVPPEMYGEKEHHPRVTVNPERTEAEVAILRVALAKDLPILGICGGHQLINVVLGGSLHQHLPDVIQSDIKHEQKPVPSTEPTHQVQISTGTLLYSIVKNLEIRVNSSHHQAVRGVARDCRINAMATDGVIEGIEVTGHPFCLGVQWHPEYETTEHDKRIFDAFIRAASG
ncbi:MAG: gamma-glutamyl-gamma-aminobutyrate hydrolase family protein [Rickettsiales bacterium]|nr:gamma-glutamyl-gamma-aminobutyrate hydrolase family protein [Rickettsiales bacterium]